MTTFNGHCACGNCNGAVLFTGDTATEVLDQFDNLVGEIVAAQQANANMFGLGDAFAAQADTLRDRLNAVPVRIVEIDEHGTELTSETGVPADLRRVYATV